MQNGYHFLVEPQLTHCFLFCIVGRSISANGEIWEDAVLGYGTSVSGFWRKIQKFKITGPHSQEGPLPIFGEGASYMLILHLSSQGGDSVCS
jgi:hypothetical protein